MLGIHHYWLFVLTGVLLNLTPGQDTMFIIGRSLTGGLRAGIAAACGIAVGCMGHTLAAALGLSVILATSTTAFGTVKLLGAIYLVYLGAKLLFSKPGPAGPAGNGSAASNTARSAAPKSVFVQGILTNVLNPKVALFFLAFLPQFIAPASRARTLAFLLLGATFITTGFVWCLVLAHGAARLQAFFRRNPNIGTLLDRVVGCVFLVLGARLAWAR
jgi:threonine/homoserine/homoserine lactone efflux protein